MVAHSRGREGVEVASARNGGIGLGGTLAILGIVLIILWSLWWGLIIALSGSSSSAASQKESGYERRAETAQPRASA
jgi:hypothetical protein